MKFSKEFKIGLLTLLSGLILYFGFRYLKGIDMFSKTHHYYAVYDKIDGLQNSNPVMVNGFTVGRVVSVRILQEQGNKMLVELEIDEGLVVGRGSKALLTDNGLLGGKMIELQLSTQGGQLNEGDTLASERMAAMMAALQEKAGPMMDNVDTLLTNLNKMTAGYADLTGEVGRLVGNAANASGRVDGMLVANQQQLATMIKNFSTLSASLVEMQKKMNPILDNLNQATDSLTKVELGRMSVEMNKTMSELRKTVEGINRAEGSMGKLMKDDSLYVSMNHTLQDLDSLFVDMKAHPKRYVHFSVFGRKEEKKKKE